MFLIDIEDHTVHIGGDGNGPYMHFSLSPADACDLLRALRSREEGLRDLATNYYDCRECGEAHHVSVLTCPTLNEEEQDSEVEDDGIDWQGEGTDV